MGKVFSVQDRQESACRLHRRCYVIITLVSDNGSEPDEAGK